MMDNGNDNKENTAMREQLIQTAIKFLQNPQVANSSLAKKQMFLQKKGLSDAEVQEACERAGAYLLHESQNREIIQKPQLPNVPVPYNSQIIRFTLLDRIKEIIHNAALLSAVIYAVYMFFQKFIKPYFFRGEKKKSIEESLDDINKSVNTSISELKSTLEDVKIEIDQMSLGSTTSVKRQLQNLESEVSTVKGLLLSRKQFPSVASNPVVPQSIPAWQMSSVQEDPADVDADPKSEDLMEIGSGSGSSEPEQATSKNSDSSLEIIYQ